MASTLSEITVEFQGEGAGAGELTWGQMNIWRATVRNNRTTNLAFPMPLPEGASVADMASMLRFMVSRYPALRTRLRFVDGPSGDPHPQQVIAASGEVPLHVVDIGADDDPVAAAEELRSRYEFTWFDYENEFPMRMGVIRQSGVLVQLVVGHSHVMVDGGGLDIVYQDFEHFDQAARVATGPGGGLTRWSWPVARTAPPGGGKASAPSSTGRLSSAGCPPGGWRGRPAGTRHVSRSSWCTRPQWSWGRGRSRRGPGPTRRPSCWPPTRQRWRGCSGEIPASP